MAQQKPIKRPCCGRMASWMFLWGGSFNLDHNYSCRGKKRKVRHHPLNHAGLLKEFA